MRLVTVTGPSFQSNHKFFLTSFFPLSCALLSSNEVHNVGILKNSKLIPQEENSFIQSLTTRLLPDLKFINFSTGKKIIIIINK